MSEQDPYVPRYPFFRDGPTPPPPEGPVVRKALMQYVFRAGDNFALMDSSNFETIEVSAEQIGPHAKFLKEGVEGLTVLFFCDRIVGIELPAFVELEVVEILDGTGCDGTRAILETGAEVLVHGVNVGTVVRVNTKTGDCVIDCGV